MTQNTVHTLFLAPTGPGVGLTSVSIGLVRALDRIGLRVRFCKPIAQPHATDKGPDRSSLFISKTMPLLNPPEPIDISHAQELISGDSHDQLMEEVVERYHAVAAGADVVIVEGLVPTLTQSYADQLNAEIASTLDAEIILVAALDRGNRVQLDERIEMAASLFGGIHHPKVLGCIVNKINMPTDRGVEVEPLGGFNMPYERLAETFDQDRIIREQCKVFQNGDFRLLGTVPFQQDMVAPRTSDVMQHLRANVINRGDIERRRVHSIAVCARTVPNMTAALRPNVLLVTPGDRDDVLLAASIAALNGVPLAGILLTSGIYPDQRLARLCERALENLPVMIVDTDTYQTAARLHRLNNEVPLDDVERIELVMNTVARRIDSEWLRVHLAADRELRLSPPAFRYALAQRARAANKRIVLPEGSEPRTVQAAANCAQRGIARCVLLGNREEILRVADATDSDLSVGVEILDPAEIRPNYVDALVEARKHKGMNRPLAEEHLEDNVVLGTMMLALGEVDGLVSGAIHTTANTIRPALQLIKTAPGAKLVSSIFFMLLPEQVLVYGDCAVNPNPNAEELADIAIQSADSAKAFGIIPRVAMISYSTGISGGGTDVEKVRDATLLVQSLRPDLIVDGPLQYDAAAIESVGKAKAPDSPVAGQATVFIFPDLNTGNTTYKAVQRSANVISIGPVLQGLKRPVNDLSRGSLVEDIVYTIAITAIQAKEP